MTTLIVTKLEDGKLGGFTEKDKRAYRRFKKLIDDLAMGELFTLRFWVPRAPKFHRLHFGMLGSLFESQEQFVDADEMRMWLQVGAGHCEFVPGPKGKVVALPKSIAFDKLDDIEFGEHHAKVKDFLRSEHAQAFLWGHLDKAKRAEMVEDILREFEQ